MAEGGRSLVGDTPEERANTRMWTRRAFLEICLPVLNYFRNSEMAEDFYRGHRIPNPTAAKVNKLVANQHLNRLDDDLENNQFICGDTISMADIILFSHLNIMLNSCPWLNPPGRKNVFAWLERIAGRESFEQATTPMSGEINLLPSS